MRFLSSFVVTSAVLSVATIASAESASATVVVAATFSSRTSLNVSSDVLQFDVVVPGTPVAADVEFSAAARTVGGGQVVLSLEPVQELRGPHGPAAVDSTLTFNGVGEGTLSGPVAPSGLTIVARWAGSGLRRGRLVFALRATAAGKYEVPLRFVLSAP